MTPSNKTFTFSSNSRETYNDVVFPGAAFVLQDDIVYKFIIRPKSKFWRFGFRFSEKSKIDFFHPLDRYKTPEFDLYKDVTVGAGDREGSTWTNENKLELTQRNFQNYEHVLFRCDTYKHFSDLEFTLGYNKASEKVTISLLGNNCTEFSDYYFIPSEFKYFNIFAWADGIEFEIDFSFETVPFFKIAQYDFTPFAVGNLNFRLGNIFDLLAPGNLTLIPASTEGTIAPDFRDRIEDLGIPYPPPKLESGDVRFYKAKGTEGFFAGYAYSVHQNDSNWEIITRLCDKLIDLLQINEYFSFIANVNLPLFGTRSGNLDAADVAEIFNRKFNNNTLTLPSFTISILNENSFYKIKRQFEGRSILKNIEESKSKSQQLLKLENDINFQLDKSSYKLNGKGEITELRLGGYRIASLEPVTKLNAIRTLDLRGTNIFDHKPLLKLTSLRNLYLSSWHPLSFDLRGLTQLTSVNISNCDLSHVEFITSFKNLTSLTLEGNSIYDIRPLKELTALETLVLGKNNISDISPISSLTKLSNLDLSSNKIHDLTPLKSLRKLNFLDVSHNNIHDISSVLELNDLKQLKANDNPFLARTNVVLDDQENHLQSIQNLLLKQREGGSRKIHLPTKVLVLGNHEGGKSSLLNYIHTNNLTYKPKSTHILKIEKYPKKGVKIPEAIFFDFGGQDYYHGIYKIFLSSDAIYLILWAHQTNENKQRLDSNGISTQDFSLDYWLCQKNYFDGFRTESNKDPLLLIQSYADKNLRIQNLPSEHRIDNEFYVSLATQNLNSIVKLTDADVNAQALNYLKTSLLALINKMKKEFSVPGWYDPFLNFILEQNKKGNYKGEIVSGKVLENYKRIKSNRLELLQNDLENLHRHGLVLYYKKELPDVVWLNPIELVNYVHKHILSKRHLQKYYGKVPVSVFSKYDSNILNLLRIQKVIYLHQFGEKGPEYVIPNFLPLVEESAAHFGLLTFEFGKPTIILRFTKFLPFGLINQMISFFGEQEDKKMFWRNQLVFIFQKKAKILINIDFQNLEIKVYCHYLSSLDDAEKSNIVKYLFYSILGMYWDLSLLLYTDYKSYVNNEIKKDEYVDDISMYQQLSNYDSIYNEEKRRPSDLFISIDSRYFINYSELCSADVDSSFINSYVIDSGKLMSKSKSIAIYPFQIFTAKTFLKMKNIFISYSKDDLKLVNKFIEHLSALKLDGKVANWYCTELVAGTNWNVEIQEHFDKADIVCFMISPNFMKTKYIHEHEVRKAFERKKIDPAFKIVPIILDFCKWTTAENNLGDYTALPYTAKPILDFKNQNMAWYIVEECIRVMIEKELDPKGDDFYATQLPKDVLKIFERIVEGKVDNNANQ